MSPTVSSSWSLLLRDAPQNSHIVQTYQDPAFLTEAVSLFVSEGLDRGDRVLLVASREHRNMFWGRLTEMGHDPERWIAQQQLRVFAAEDLLPRLLENGMPQEDRFLALTREYFRSFGPARNRCLRVHGEMVDLLYQQGNIAAAIRLESFWNNLLQRSPVTLFCAYAVDPLMAEAYDMTLPHLCKIHSHLIPVWDEAALETALDRALEETLGYSLAGMLRSLNSDGQNIPQMPRAQQRLLWLHQNLPGTSKKVFKLTRGYYQAGLSRKK